MLINQATLEGQFVLLEPLTEQHIKPLEKAVADGDSPKLWFASVPTAEQMADYVHKAIADMAQGNIAYAVRSKASGEVVGTTRYYNVDEANRRAMIGFTWYANAAKRTPINTESKLLLLTTLFARTTSTRPHVLPLSAWVQSRTASCVTTRSCPTAPTAIPWCIRSLPASGQRLKAIC